MEKRYLTCIGCPLGCQIQVTVKDGRPIKIQGNTCKRGAEYAAAEVTHPLRTLTSTMKVEGGMFPVVSVKTKEKIPKEKMMDCLKEIKGRNLTAPVRTGDVVIADAAGTGVAVVATRTVEMEQEIQ